MACVRCGPSVRTPGLCPQVVTECGTRHGGHAVQGLQGPDRGAASLLVGRQPTAPVCRRTWTSNSGTVLGTAFSAGDVGGLPPPPSPCESNALVGAPAGVVSVAFGTLSERLFIFRYKVPFSGNRECTTLWRPFGHLQTTTTPAPYGGEGDGGGGVGTRPRYLIVCLQRRLLASRHCSF